MKFKIGDIVKYNNETNDGNFYYQILNIIDDYYLMVCIFVENDTILFKNHLEHVFSLPKQSEQFFEISSQYEIDKIKIFK